MINENPQERKGGDTQEIKKNAAEKIAANPNARDGSKRSSPDYSQLRKNQRRLWLFPIIVFPM